MAITIWKNKEQEMLLRHLKENSHHKNNPCRFDKSDAPAIWQVENGEIYDESTEFKVLFLWHEGEDIHVSGTWSSGKPQAFVIQNHDDGPSSFHWVIDNLIRGLCLGNKIEDEAMKHFVEQDDGKIQYSLILSDKQLELLSNICHNYKDDYRGCKEEILQVMELEKSLVQQTGGAYAPDTTYNIKNPR